MKDKYYTPKINEFHEGFVYESRFDKDSEWKKYQIETFYNMQSICDKVRSGDVRVKYLDREDIESLGFTLSEREEYKYNTMIIFTKDNYVLGLFPNNAVLIYSTDLLKRVSSTLCYNLIVKNKSELVKLLSQLNIK